jgi:hypothetical protein
MVIADGSGTWAKDVKHSSSPPLHYGGISKSCYKLENDEWVQVPYFWVVDTGDEGSSSVGVTIFSEDQEAGPAVRTLLSAVPTGLVATDAVGLFPCFTRGVNQYGTEDVESSQIVQVLPHARVYGMFAHGELGPVAFTGFPSKSTRPSSTSQSSVPIPCTQHSMTSILALHATASGKES